MKQAGINSPINSQPIELWNSKPTKYSNKLNTQDVVINHNLNQFDTTLTTTKDKKKNAKKSTNKNNQLQKHSDRKQIESTSNTTNVCNE